MSRELRFEIIHHAKKVPLAISRGVSTGSENLYVFVREGEHTGIGEMSPATARPDQTAAKGQADLKAFLADFDLNQASIYETDAAMREREIDPATRAALDIALWDLLAKEAGLPLYRLLGLPRRAMPTSVTSGIASPDVVRERVPALLASTGAKCLKVKLGSPEGLEADQANFEAARESARPFGVRLRVDANGGWDVAGARRMIAWLAEREVEYVEQPLAEGEEEGLTELYAGSPLPLFIDESCRTSEDVARWHDRVHGVNLKLMKSGGITEGLRVLATARAHGLRTMIGCMSEGSIAIAAGAALSALLDYIDLDSHLNLDPDPAEGLEWSDGRVLPPDQPGHGARLKHA